MEILGRKGRRPRCLLCKPLAISRLCRPFSCVPLLAVPLLLEPSVALGGILALTNVERKETAQPTAQVRSAQPNRLSILGGALVDRAITWVTPAQLPAQPGAQLEAPEQVKQLGQPVATPSAQVRVVKPDADTERIERLERVRLALRDKPDADYNELGRLTGLAAATTQKYRQQIEQEQIS
jgi:hypothetical protein